MAGEQDSLAKMMELGDEARQLGEEFPSHEVTVIWNGAGYRFQAKAKPGERGPHVFITASASEIRAALAGAADDSR